MSVLVFGPDSGSPVVPQLIICMLEHKLTNIHFNSIETSKPEIEPNLNLWAPILSKKKKKLA